MSASYLLALTEVVPEELLAQWTWLVPGKPRLIALSLFGHLFLLGSDQSVSCLDVVGGSIVPVAYCLEEFEFNLAGQSFQYQWLLSDLADAAAQLGLQRAAGHCLAFRTPPFLGGTVSTDNLVAWPLLAYHSGLAKLLRQVHDLPLGTELRIKPERGA